MSRTGLSTDCEHGLSGLSSSGLASTLPESEQSAPRIRRQLHPVHPVRHPSFQSLAVAIILVMLAALVLGLQVFG